MTTFACLPFKSAFIRTFVLCALLLSLIPPPLQAKPDTPQWLQNVMSVPCGDLANNADAIVILNHMTVNVQADGKMKKEIRYALRILNKGGARNAVAALSYNNMTDKVSDLRAWLILPSGEIRAYNDKDFVHFENKQDSLYSEMWNKLMDASSAAVPGSMFAYSYTIRQVNIIPQIVWDYSGSLPLLESKLSIILPSGWEIKTTPIGDADFSHVTAGNTHTLSVGNKQARKHEDWSACGDLDEFVGIDIIPSAKDAQKTRYSVIKNWQSIGSFAAEFMNPAAVPDETVRATATSLTKECTTDMDRIRKLAVYVQKVNYSSVMMDLASGGGYKPVAAPLVFSRNYGDCKDKTALMRAMLASIGIESYAVGCRLDQNSLPHEEWPSPAYFNHCITAIRVGADVNAPAIVEHPDFGRLLLFDPTEPRVPLGHLRDALCNSQFLILDVTSTGLVKSPPVELESRTEIDASVAPSGRLTGTLVEIRRGKDAVDERALSRRMTRTAYERELGKRFRRRSMDTRLTSWTVTDDFDNNQFTTTIDFEAPDYARRIGTNKMLLRTYMGVNSAYVPDDIGNNERKNDIVLSPESCSGKIRLTIPEGYVAVEIPHGIDVSEQFGHLGLACSVDGQVVTITFSSSILQVRIPPEEFERVRTFFRIRQKAIQSAVVIRRTE